MTSIDHKSIDSLENNYRTQGRQINDLASGLKRTESYMIGIGIVTVAALAAFLLTGWGFFSESLRFKSSTYQSLIDKVNQTNQKIDKQNEMIYKDQIENLQLQLINLKQKNPYLK
jgi:hypothetical protein